MATTTINNDGTIAITLSAQEQHLAQLLLASKGAGALTEVFNLWFSKAVEPIFAAKFAQLAPQDQADFLTKIAAVKGV